MRVLLLTYGRRGDVELAGLAAPVDFAEPPAGIGVMPTGGWR
jgi:hypothetical protein